jgi:ribosomal protein S14
MEHSCDVCGKTENVRKRPNKDEWYCKEHQPLKVAVKKQPCFTCGSINRNRKLPDKDEWYCKTHWPLEKSKISVKHQCEKCGLIEGVKKWPNKNEWYCKSHWPARQRPHKIEEPCSECGKTDNVVRITLKKIFVCRDCAVKNHICLVCGDKMVEIGRKKKHYICIKARQNGHQNGKIQTKTATISTVAANCLS